jgi:hypothetical protein
VLAEELRLGHDGETLGRDARAAREVADECQRFLPLRPERLLERRVDRERPEPMRLEQRDEPRAMRRAPGDEHQSRALALPLAQALGDAGERAVVAGRRADRDAVGRVRDGAESVAGEALEALDLDARPALEPPPPRGGREVERVGLGMEATLRRRRGGVGLDLPPGGFGRGLVPARLLGPDERAGGQEVGERPELVVEVGQQRLHARQHEAGAHGLDEVASLLAREADVGGPRVDGTRRRLPEPVLREFAHGQEQHVLDAIERALRRGVEEPDALDVVAEELEADGARVADGEDVEDAAAHGEVARVLHERHAMVAPAGETLRERFGGDRLAGDDVHDRLREHGARQAPLAPRLDRRNDDRIGRLQEMVEALGARRDRLARRRDRLERRDLPAREDVHATCERTERGRIAPIEAQVRGERLGGGRVGGEHEDGAGVRGVKTRQDERGRTPA